MKVTDGRCISFYQYFECIFSDSISNHLNTDKIGNLKVNYENWLYSEMRDNPPKAPNPP